MLYLNEFSEIKFDKEIKVKTLIYYVSEIHLNMKKVIDKESDAFHCL